MQIQPSSLSLSGQSKGALNQLMSQMAPGDLVEAVVVKANTTSNQLSLRVAESIVIIPSSEKLQSGQKVLLQRGSEQGQPSLTVVSSESATINNADQKVVATSSLSTLSNSPKVGDQIPVEVKQLTLESTVLMKSRLNNDDRIFEVDISRLSQYFKLGDKLVLEVVSESPLELRIKSDNKAIASKPLESIFNKIQTMIVGKESELTLDLTKLNKTVGIVNEKQGNDELSKSKPASRYQYVSDKVQHLLSLQADKPSIDKALTFLASDRLPPSVKVIFEQILKHTLDKSGLTDLNLLKQAITKSGFLTERNALAEPQLLNQDLKANLMRIVDTLTTLSKQQNNNEVNTLLYRLPNQTLAALSVNGKTPAQLVNLLLSPTERTPLPVINTLLTPVIRSSEQAALISRSLSSLSQSLPSYELLALFKEVEQIQSKIQLNQLLSLKESTNTATQTNWLFDLPIKNGHNVDFVQLQIEQEKQHDAEQKENDIWQVQLRLDTQQLGPVKATISFSELDVNIILTAQNQDSADLLKEHINRLEKSLDKLEINLMSMRFECGSVPMNIATTVAREQHDLKQNKVDISV